MIIHLIDVLDLNLNYPINKLYYTFHGQYSFDFGFSLDAFVIYE